MISYEKRFSAKLISAFISIAMVTSLVSAPGIAWAVGADGSSVAEQAQTAQGEETATSASDAAEASSDASNADRVNDTVEITPSSDANSAASAAEASDDAAANQPADQPTEGAHEQKTDSLPVADQNAAADVEMVTAELSLEGEAAQTAITYNGLSYVVNPEAPETVTLVGLAAKAPTGSVQVPSEITVGSASYAVTNICTLRGGVFANC